MALQGWKRVPGSSRYVSPSGQEVSRRQYDNARARDVGFASYNQFAKLSHYGRGAGEARTARGQDYHRWSYAYSRTHGMKPKEARALGSDFNKLYAETFLKGKARGHKDVNRMSRSIGGPLDRFLRQTGLRTGSEGYRIGDSPKVVEILAA